MKREEFRLVRHRYGAPDTTVAHGIRYADTWTLNFPDGLLLMAPGWCEMTLCGGRANTSLWQSADALMEVHGRDGAIELVWED